MSEDLDLDTEDEKKEHEQRTEELRPLTERFQEVLTDRVSEVRVSERLAESPVCLVVPEGGIHAHIERMLRASDYDLPQQKRILEINPKHPIVANLERLNGESAANGDLTDWIEMLYDQALITEGSPVEDPARFASRLSRLLQQATAKA
jgi:molecular chaperone HtpG